MAWNQPGGNNNNPWGKKPPAGGGELDQAFKDWQKRVESLFGGSGGKSGSFLVVLVAIAVAIWMITGFYTVNVGSQGVVQRFGRYVATVPNGWGWRFPWPIEQVTEVNTSRVTPTSYKSSVLTAEPNMVELEIAVQYKINDPEDYLFKVRDPVSTLGEVSESAIREVVGRSDQQAILESKRVEIADATREIMQRTLDAYGAGMEVMEVKITGVQVPEAVQQSQRDSVKAKADRERVTREAQAYSNEILPKAEGLAARTVLEAEAYKSQIVQQATGDASRFSQLVAAYEQAPDVTRERLYIETIESVLRNSRKVIIDSKSGNGNMIYLPLDKILERRSDTDAQHHHGASAGLGRGRVRQQCRYTPEGGTLMGSRILTVWSSLLGAILLLSASTFVVREQEQALRVQFKSIIGKDYKPGLHFKVPFIDDVHQVRPPRADQEVRRRAVPDQRKPGALCRLLHQVAHQRRSAVLPVHRWRR